MIFSFFQNKMSSDKQNRLILSSKNRPCVVSHKKNKIAPRIIPAVLLFLFLLQTVIPSALANVLGNANFAVPIGNGTAGNWDSTNNVVRITTAPLVPAFTALPGPGALQLVVKSDGSVPPKLKSVFTFQTSKNVKAGDYVVFSCMAESNLATVPGATGYGNLKIEFKKVNSDGSDTLISNVQLDTAGFPIDSTVAPPGGGAFL